jgi:hypothetical protein
MIGSWTVGPKCAAGPAPIGQMRLFAAIIGYFVLAYALDRLPPSSKLVTLALVLFVFALCFAACLARPTRLKMPSTQSAFALLAVLAGWEILCMLRRPMGPMQLPPWQYLHNLHEQWQIASSWRQRLFLPGFFPLAVLGLAAIALTYLARAAAWRWRVGSMVACYGYLGAWMIFNSPAPPIDVWSFQQHACEVLIKGENPYSASYPLGDRSLIPSEVIDNDSVKAFPYPPLNIFAVLPGYLVGDVRWSMLAAMLASAVLLIAIGRKLALPTGHIAELAVFAFLCHPRGLMVLGKAWTEPLLVFFAFLSAWAAVARRNWLLGFAIPALVTVKQTGFLCAPALWKYARPPWRNIVAGSLAALVLMAPFVVSSAADFWKGTITFHLRSPFRPDSLSITAAVATAWGYAIPSALGFLAAALVILFLVRQRDLSLSQSALGNSAVVLAFMLLNKAAHMNYFWWAGAFLPLAMIAAAAETTDDTDRTDQTLADLNF